MNKNNESSQDDTIRGIRNNFISCMCYDIKNNEFVFVYDLDMRKPLIRFIPIRTIILK